MQADPNSRPWYRLKGKIAQDVLKAPKTGGDPLNQGQWTEVDERNVNLLANNVLGKPWADCLALTTAIITAARYDVHTIRTTIGGLNCAFTDLFQAFNISKMDQWDPREHITAYLKGEVMPEHSDAKRSEFWSKYSMVMKQANKWLLSLPHSEQKRYRRFIIPSIDPEYVRHLVKRQAIKELKEGKRKSETNAIVPRLAEIRAEAHLRYNQMVRIRHTYNSALEEIKREGHGLPFEFSYEETLGTEPNLISVERLSFRVWDRQSFVLGHQAKYSETTIYEAKHRIRYHAEGKNHFFLEFVRAERLIGDAPPQGLWFDDLIKKGAIGTGPKVGPADEVAEKQEWLKAWGYRGRNPNALVFPFMSHVGGVLTVRPSNGDCSFMCKAQKRTNRILINVEPLYVAALFGLLALDIFTTTGMRINEAMQIRLDPNCLTRLEMLPPPEAKDQVLRIRYALRLIPKGERSDKPQNYFISKETIRIITKVAQLLEEHYALDVQKGQGLPAVPFTIQSGRKHRFGRASYLFQYFHSHIGPTTITSCMRFLLHGMVFLDAEGKPVVIKSHLLRHAFATHAAQVEKIPIDIVAMMLKHKSINVTQYYSKPTESMVSDAADGYLVKIATHINVHEAILRSPQELETIIKEAQGKVGALSNVLGGECVIDTPCIAKFACIGCAGHVPDPAKRYQVEAKLKWAMEQIEMAVDEGLTLEAEQMRKLARDCELELREMDLIEAYWKDENRAVIIQIKGRRD